MRAVADATICRNFKQHARIVELVVRAQLAHANQELKLSFRLDPFVMQRENPE